MIAELGRTAWSVVLAVTPLVLIFLVFQALFLDIPRREVRRVLGGTLLAAAGLFLFLAGVGIGFLPFGRALGEAAGALEAKWLLLPFGALLGFVTTWGEPAVRILADQVEEASSGSIRRSAVVWSVCIGVAVATGLGLLRAGVGFPILWVLVPGYLLVLAMMRASGREFVAVAADASGVATGPLANTFLLALALGAAAGAGAPDALERGLGLVALIALAPLVSVMALGFLVQRKLRRKESQP